MQCPAKWVCGPLEPHQYMHCAALCMVLCRQLCVLGPKEALRALCTCPSGEDVPIIWFWVQPMPDLLPFPSTLPCCHKRLPELCPPPPPHPSSHLPPIVHSSLSVSLGPCDAKNQDRCHDEKTEVVSGRFPGASSGSFLLLPRSRDRDHGGALSSARAVQLFGCLAVLETHTLRY